MSVTSAEFDRIVALCVRAPGLLVFTFYCHALDCAVREFTVVVEDLDETLPPDGLARRPTPWQCPVCHGADVTLWGPAT